MADAIVLQHWQSHATTASQVRVLPDGCRDLIFKHTAGAAPVYFVTDVAAGCDMVDVRAQVRYDGFRLQPGVRIDQAALLTSLQDGLSTSEITDRLQNYVQPLGDVSEALACLAQGRKTVAAVAAELGVQSRSLQRLLRRETGWSPVFWLRLARARRAACQVIPSRCLADLSYDMDYADQAHMTREFRHWFGVTPRLIQRDVDWAAQHLGLGYGV